MLCKQKILKQAREWGVLLLPFFNASFYCAFLP